MLRWREVQEKWKFANNELSRYESASSYLVLYCTDCSNECRLEWFNSNHRFPFCLLIEGKQKEVIINLVVQARKIISSFRMSDVHYKIIARSVISSAKRIFCLTKDKNNQCLVSEVMKPIQKSCRRKSQRLINIAKSLAKKSFFEEHEIIIRFDSPHFYNFPDGLISIDNTGCRFTLAEKNPCILTKFCHTNMLYL